MTVEEKQRVQNIINQIAWKQGVAPDAVRASMQEALDEAWKRSLKEPATRATWKIYFPANEKPSLEEFISRIALAVDPHSCS